MKGADPVGTLECPDGFVLDLSLNMCRPASPVDQASGEGDNFVRPEDMPAHLRPRPPKVVNPGPNRKVLEKAAPFKPTGQMERCIQNVKANLRKKNSTFKDQSIKSAAIAICRSRLKQ